MWKCHKCGKPVYFAERKQSLGYDWHPECLRCEECGKRLNPGQHAEHKGVPYCHVPCYGALFGPQLFGHGTRVESHKSFGQKGAVKPSSNGPTVPQSQLEHKLKVFNQYFDGKSNEIRSREVNGRLVLEGALRIHWGVKGVIHLKENDDQRTVVTVRKRNSCRYSVNKGSVISPSNSYSGELASPQNNCNVSSSSLDTGICVDRIEKISLDSASSSRCSEDSGNQSSSSVSVTPTPPQSPAIVSRKAAATLPSKVNYKQMQWDELDQLLQVERKVDDGDKLYQTMPTCLPSQASIESSESISMSHSNSQSEIYNTLSQSSSTSSSQETKSETSSIELPIDGSDATLKPSDSKISPQHQLHFADSLPYDESTLRPNSQVDIKKLLDSSNDLMPLDQEAMSRSLNEGTLKANSPIDPKKINDSLKLYVDMVRSIHSPESLNNPDNFSINCENKLEEILSDNNYFNDDYPKETLKRIKNYENKVNKIQESDRTPEHLPKSDPSAYNRAISMDSSWIGSLDDSANESNYELSRSISGPEQFKGHDEDSASDNETINYAHPVDDQILVLDDSNNMVVRRVHKGSTAIKRRTGKRRQRAAALRRRCSINGHFYNRETSFFTPPYGSQMSVWVTSLVSTQEVINLMLDKYKVDSNAQRFALFVVRDNGEQRKLRDDEYPLLVRVTLGPHEDITRLFLMDADKTGEVTPEVAQFINLSVYECEAILNMYSKEEQRELNKIKHRYAELRQRIKQRMEDLKVRL